MSRGLGIQQKRMLQAIRRVLAQGCGREWCTVAWAVNEFCKLDNRMGERVQQHHDRVTAAKAAYEMTDRVCRAFTRARADAGDAAAIESQRISGMYDVLMATASSQPKSIYQQCCGAIQERDVPEADKLLNPSRIITSLAKRGLVERHPEDYGYGLLRLTDAGRAIT